MSEENDEEELEAVKTERDELKQERDSLNKKVESLTKDVAKLREILTAENPDVDELQAKNAELENTLKEAADTLQMFVDNQKTELIHEITQTTNLNADELKKMSLDNLRLIKATVDSMKDKGNTKGVKAAGSGVNTGVDSTFTLSDLYQKPQAVKPEVK